MKNGGTQAALAFFPTEAVADRPFLMNHSLLLLFAPQIIFRFAPGLNLHSIVSIRVHSWFRLCRVGNRMFEALRILHRPPPGTPARWHANQAGRPGWANQIPQTLPSSRQEAATPTGPRQRWRDPDPTKPWPPARSENQKLESRTEEHTRQEYVSPVQVVLEEDQSLRSAILARTSDAAGQNAPATAKTSSAVLAS